MRFPVVAPGLVALLMMGPGLAADELDDAIRDVSQVSENADGSAAAARAVQLLKQQQVDFLPRLMEAMDTDNIVAANWYRQAYETIVARELAGDDPQLPTDFLRTLVLDQQRQGRLRRLAWDLLDSVDPDFRQTYLKSLLADPEFSSDAVALTMQAAARLLADDKQLLAVEKYRQAFEASRQSGQIIAAADQLARLEHPVDIIQHMGLLNRWYLLGPFDAPGFSGFKTSFPPQKKVDLAAQYDGKDGQQIRWRPVQTSDRLGQLNLIQEIAAVKEAVGYAYAEVHSPRTQAAELRCGADDNMTVWINGKLAFSRGQWLNGTRLDRFSSPIQLRKGTNKILIKICQGPQHKNPAVPNNWSMQLRLCNASGGSIGVRTLLPSAEELAAADKDGKE